MQHQFAGRSTLLKAAIIIDETSGGGRRTTTRSQIINTTCAFLGIRSITCLVSLLLVGPANHLQRIQPASTLQQSAQWQAQVRAVRIPDRIRCTNPVGCRIPPPPSFPPSPRSRKGSRRQHVVLHLLPC